MKAREGLLEGLRVCVSDDNDAALPIQLTSEGQLVARKQLKHAGLHAKIEVCNGGLRLRLRNRTIVLHVSNHLNNDCTLSSREPMENPLGYVPNGMMRKK